MLGSRIVHSRVTGYDDHVVHHLFALGNIGLLGKNFDHMVALGMCYVQKHAMGMRRTYESFDELFESG